jgi:hypothetical protein
MGNRQIPAATALSFSLEEATAHKHLEDRSSFGGADVQEAPDIGIHHHSSPVRVVEDGREPLTERRRHPSAQCQLSQTVAGAPTSAKCLQ